MISMIPLIGVYVDRKILEGIFRELRYLSIIYAIKRYLFS